MTHSVTNSLKRVVVIVSSVLFFRTPLLPCLRHVTRKLMLCFMHVSITHHLIYLYLNCIVVPACRNWYCSCWSLIRAAFSLKLFDPIWLLALSPILIYTIWGGALCSPSALYPWKFMWNMSEIKLTLDQAVYIRLTSNFENAPILNFSDLPCTCNSIFFPCSISGYANIKRFCLMYDYQGYWLKW